jgi:hypothetical protein
MARLKTSPQKTQTPGCLIGPDYTTEVHPAGEKLAFREVRAKEAEKELTQKA